MGLVARLFDNTAAAEQRRSPRHKLSLEVEVSGADGAPAAAIIHNLSQVGFLMETSAQFATGERIDIPLAANAAVPAQVIWSCGRLFGCEFQRPISSALLSGALLKASPASAAPSVPQGLKLGVEEMPQEAPGATARETSDVPLVVGLSLAFWAAAAAALWLL